MPPRTIPWLKRAAPVAPAVTRKTTAAPKTKKTTTAAPAVKPSSTSEGHPSPASKRQRTRPTTTSTTTSFADSIADDGDDPLACIELGAPVVPVVSAAPNASSRYMNSDDDQWVMVEDEFLSTAQLFTRSVHRREYERLQLEAASKNASQISSIQRPVSGKSTMSKETLRKRVIAEKQRVQRTWLGRAGVAKKAHVDDSSDDDDDMDTRGGWVNSELRTLMRGNMGSQATLGNLIQPKPVATRAAAGFIDSQSAHSRRWDPVSACRPCATSASRPAAAMHQQPDSVNALGSATDNEDDDDLDALVIKNAVVKPEPKPTILFTRNPQPQSSKPKGVTRKKPPPKVDLIDSDDDILSFMAPKPATSSRFRGKATAARERAIKSE